jgi:type IV secretory pathway TraG/TraD family ATPase VirD4
MIVLDIKGEAASVTARRRREMGHEVVIMPSYQIAVCSA